MSRRMNPRMRNFIKTYKTMKNKKYIYIIGAILVFTVAGNIGRTVFDSDAIRGGLERGDTEEELLAQLQEQVEDSRVRVKINEQPQLDKNSGATNIIVQNSIENSMNQRVEYYDEEGELVYSTKELYPGDEELSAVFPGVWTTGEYTLTAHIWAIDRETSEELAITEVQIKLTVK